MIAHNVVDRNTNGKGNSSIDQFPIDLFGIQLGSLSFHNRMSKFTQIDDFGPGQTLSDQALQGQIDNFGSLLILGANITTSYRMYIVVVVVVW